MMPQSSKNLERKFLRTEISFQTSSAPHAAPASRFPKVLALYMPTHFVTAGGTSVFEWAVSDAAQLKTTAKMYYVRYNLAAK